MSDSIPSATADPDSVDQPLPANAEDRMAAAALNSLNTDGLAGDTGPSKGPSSAEQEALSKAMSRLEVAAGQDREKRKAGESRKKEAEVKKAVKINAADVTLLVRVYNPCWWNSVTSEPVFDCVLFNRSTSWICIKIRPQNFSGLMREM